MKLARAATTALLLVTACSAPQQSSSGDVLDTRQADGDAADDEVALTLVEELPIDFGAMDGGVAEGAVLQLADLSSEPAFVADRARYRCAAIDTSASALGFDQAAPAGAAIELTIEVAARASSDFTLLARYTGPAEAGAEVPLDAPPTICA